MSFTCNQEWEQMAPSACGRYCTMCKKEVVDLSRMPVQQIKALYKNPEGVCARFSIEQTDEDIIKPIEAKTIKKWITLSLSFLALQARPSSLKNRDSINTQQVYAVPNPVKDVVFNDSAAIANKQDAEPEEIKKPAKPFLTTAKRHYYWSKRFPFIKAVRRRYHLMGAFSF